MVSKLEYFPIVSIDTVAMIIGKVHMGTINGKLKGTIDTTTPKGLLTSLHVTPRLTSRILPGITLGRDMAYSTVSLPLAILK